MFYFLFPSHDIPARNDSLYGEGSISDWLKNNTDKHLFSNDVYGEPMLDLDEGKVFAWHSQSLKSLIDALVEDRRKAKMVPDGESANLGKYNRGYEEALNTIATLLAIKEMI